MDYKTQTNYTPEELRELQLKSLEMFRYFKKICDENKLLMFFCGGCCIGALRHKGFIPWDDDIDIFMPRDDYEKLKTIWQQKADNERYAIYYPKKDFIDHNIFITIRDAQTTFIKPYQQDLDINQGLMLDIMPLDGYPSSSYKRKMQKLWAMIYSLFCAQVAVENHGRAMNIISRVLLKIVPGRALKYRLWHMAEKKMTKHKIDSCQFITELCAGPHYMQMKYPKAAFESVVYQEFEGEMMPLPVGYDVYLKTAFGDYMQLPPKEKQVAHHDSVYCDLKTSYKKYKGKYYLCKGETK